MARDRLAAAQEREWRRCKGKSPTDVDALRFFLETYCRIQHPEHGSILIPLRPAQSEILETWCDERYSIVLKARQIGWSTLVALYSLWLSFFWPDNMILMLSKGEREAEMLLAKATYAYERLPEWLRTKGPRRLTKNLKKLAFDNASSITSVPSKEDPGRSATASLVVVDEWAFLENAEQAWASIEPIADVGGRVIGLSTANGSGDFFHGMWTRAEAGVVDFKPMFYPWWANTERDDEWYETKQRTMLEWQLHQEYPSTPEEAFIKSGRPVFDVDKLRAIKPIEPIAGSLQTWEHGIRAPKWEDNDNGFYDILAWPDRTHTYVIGADTARGLDYGDYSSAHVIDLTTDPNDVVATWHGHIDPDLLGEELAKLGWFYFGALIGVEENMHGLTTLKALQRVNYNHIYYRRTLDERHRKGVLTKKIGWYTSASTKPLMIDELGAALRSGELRCLDAATIGELVTYVRDEKGQTSGQPFDDRVISLAIANQMRKYARSAPDEKPPEATWGTFAFFMQREIDRAKAEKKGVPIGFYNRRTETSA